MNFYLVEKTLKIKILLKILQQDSEELLDLLFNRDTICERSIMNAKVERENNFNVNHRVGHTITMK